MASRRNIPPAYDERNRQESGMMHRGPFPSTHHPMEPLPSPEQLEHKLASQAAELEQLTKDNRKLAAGHMALRQDHAAAMGELERLREHMRSVQTEGDIEIRILLDKIAKREADIRAGDHIKRELQEAHIESRSVMTSKLELSAKIEQATKELECSRANIEKLPEMRAELDNLKQEHQRLRITFEYEKGLNVEKVEQLKILERDLIRTVQEVERLCTEVADTEKRAIAPIPQGGPYMNPTDIYTAFHGNGTSYPESSGGPHLHTLHGAPVQMMDPYVGVGFAGGCQAMNGPSGSGGFAVGPQVIHGPVNGSDGANGNAAWGGVYGASHAPV